jgi:hypothetical protein
MFAAWRSAVVSIVEESGSPSESEIVRSEHSRVAKLASSDEMFSPIDELQISAGWCIGEMIMCVEYGDFSGALENAMAFCDSLIWRTITEFLPRHSNHSADSYKRQLSDARELLGHEKDWLISALVLARQWALTPNSPSWCEEPAFVLRMADVDGWRLLGEAS